MEAYSYPSSSFSSSTYLSSLYHQRQQQTKPTIINSSLHSVRKSPAKPWKKPIAPLPPTPPKIYKVDSANFMEVVQKLTGALPEKHQSRRLQSIAPSPINIETPTLSEGQKMPFSANLNEMVMNETMDMKPWRMPVVGPLGLSLSPSSPAWCSFPLLSPGTVSSLEQSIVL